MGKKQSALEELRKRLKEEKALAEKDISPIPTAEEAALFLEQKILSAFERIKEEIEPHYVKVRTDRRKRTVGFYITEKEANYFCSVLVDREKRFIYFKSHYSFHSSPGFSRAKTTMIQLLNKQIYFQSLEEIRFDKIIELFNKSFFSRVAAREDHLRDEKARKGFNDLGEVKEPDEEI